MPPSVMNASEPASAAPAPVVPASPAKKYCPAGLASQGLVPFGPSQGAEPFQKEWMLDLLRHVPMPVVVVTAATVQDPPPMPAKPAAEQTLLDKESLADLVEEEEGAQKVLMRGLTCSSFCSISMDPPLVSVCIHKGSQFLSFLETGRTHIFAIHVLKDDNKELACAFARRHAPLSPAAFGAHAAGADWELKWLKEEHELSNGLGCTGGTPHAVPLLKGTMSALICQRRGMISLGDHQMLVGEVVAHSNDHEGGPLTYMNRAFHKLGEML